MKPFIFSTRDDNATCPTWHRRYWLIAAVPALALYAFEAAKVSSFEAVRAPNVSLAVQLAVMLAFFTAWVATPRVIWAIRRHAGRLSWISSDARLIGVLGTAGLIMSAVHLLALAFILRVFYSPPGWNAGHLLQSFTEVWLAYAGFWFILYALACLVILVVTRKLPRPQQVRIEVRQNGKAHTIGAAEIYWIEASGNYLQLHTARGMFTLRKSLSAISGEVGPGFLKSHRGALVNACHVRAIEPVGAHDSYRVLLSSGASAPLSRHRLRGFRNLVKTQPVS